jgi:Ca-activated chloride channel family protein
MRYIEEKATIVLVTDGLETCGGDPCALAQALEESGADFTVHVVGFGLGQDEEAQVACLAENTGGTFLSASNAAELASAMTETVAVEPPSAPEPEAIEVTPPPIEEPPAIPPPPEVVNEVGFYMYAFDVAGVQIESTVEWAFYDLETGELEDEARGFFLVGALPGKPYRVVAAYGNLEGALEFDLTDAGFSTFNVTLYEK